MIKFKKKIKYIDKLNYNSSTYLKKSKTKNLAIKSYRNNIILDKQLIKRMFSLTEKQLKNYIYYSLNKKLKPSIILYNTLFMRFDFIIFIVKFARTIYEARQLITHGFFFINGEKQTKPGYICKIDFVITTNSNIAIKNFINFTKQNNNNFLFFSLNQYNCSCKIINYPIYKFFNLFIFNKIEGILELY